MISRRKFLQNGSTIGLLGLAPAAAVAKSIIPGVESVNTDIQVTVPLNGRWDFIFDPDNKGITGKWFSSQDKAGNWEKIEVPHTWQIVPEHADYFGTAWYRKEFFVPATWKDKTIRVEF
ncbi:MAG: hypothetical protein EPN39_14060, partial [Chitinophagaceae bacterium]